MMKKHLTLFVLGATLFANTAYMSAMDSATPAAPVVPVAAAVYVTWKSCPAVREFFGCKETNAGK